MEQAEILALPSRTWEAEYLEDTSLRRLTLEYYDREHTSIRRYLSFLGLDREAARDIVQETFLRLHEHLLKGGNRDCLRAWLYRVAHNLARNTQASYHVTKTELLEEETPGSELAATDASAEQELISAERAARIRQTIGQLSPAQRDCLILRAQGLKYREIGDVLNLSTSTVGENIKRGLERLKELI